MRAAMLSDVEFDLLVAGQPLVFAIQARAQSVANDLRQRAASVAIELRRLIAAGEVANPLASAMIANGFDRLAHAMDDELREPNLVRWVASPPTATGRGPEDYEREVWWTSAESGFANGPSDQEAA